MTIRVSFSDRPTFWALILGLGVVLALAGCDSEDRFESAKTLKAPSASASPVKPLRAVEGQTLPPGHPPIGQGMGQVPSARPNGGGEVKSSAKPGTNAALVWTAPAAWKSVPPSSSMRKAEYVIAGDPGQEPAVLAVFHFSGSGGSVDANISRWIGQFRTHEGAPVEAARERFSADELAVHTVDVAGTYSPGMSGGGGSKEGQRMLAGIVETPTGPYFFKLIGPAALVAKEVDAFQIFLKGIRRSTSK